jgi:hypothetical protein
MTIALTQDPNGYPRVYEYEDIYDPDNPPVDLSDPARHIPAVGSLVVTTTGVIYRVTAVDSETKASTLEPATIHLIDQDEHKQLSIIDYGNTKFRVYVDDRVTPARLRPDGRLAINGNCEYYRIVKDYDTETPVVVSRHYDGDGVYVGGQVPMQAVLTDGGDPSGVYYPMSCKTTTEIAEETPLKVEIYNEHGALIAEVVCFAKDSSILNESIGYRPQIVGARIDGAQVRDNGDLFLYQNQDPDDLNARMILIYDDGQEVTVDIDNQKAWMIGLETIVASYPGLRQPLVGKYFLSDDEDADPEISEGTMVSANANVVIVPNEANVGVKISVIPSWSVATSAYTLEYYLYTDDRDWVKRITDDVTISSGTYNGATYGIYQNLTLSVDLNDVDPILWPEALVYTQTVSIRLQNQLASDRYLIKDSEVATTVYGAATPTSPRPVIHYDDELEQYFVPSNLVTTEEKFITAFYEYGAPPYNLDVEEEPVAPTHFTVRDPASGSAILAEPIAVGDYDTAWTITGSIATRDRFVDGTMLIEFLKETGEDEYLILYGTPVDAYLSETGYVP